MGGQVEHSRSKTVRDRGPRELSRPGGDSTRSDNRRRSRSGHL